MISIEKISAHVESRRKEAIQFLQELIRTPSPSWDEAAAAELVATKMRGIGFDEVDVDELNDATGVIKGVGSNRNILFNGHIDHVPPGDMSEPYSGKLMDGEPFGVEGEVVYGRAASDMKGAVAAMVMAGGILRKLGVELKGDYMVAAVAQEEVGGAGTAATVEAGFLGDVVVIGEATNMEMALGHRGSTKAEVVVKGRSCHASAPERGINALFKAVDILDRIRSELIPALPDHPLYGKTTLTATQISVKPDTPNVVPEACCFTLDCRYNPNYSVKALGEDLEAVISRMKGVDLELEAEVVTRRSSREFTGFYTAPEEYKEVEEARQAAAEVLGREPELKVWQFVTDGRFYSWRGLPVIGFGPGEERSAHTHQDFVRIDDYLETIKVYAWLACVICGVN
jgi:acetylornithine deacetylase/succinyl-diaminopimelate desuccinylase family protein